MNTSYFKFIKKKYSRKKQELKNQKDDCKGIMEELDQQEDDNREELNRVLPSFLPLMEITRAEYKRITGTDDLTKRITRKMNIIEDEQKIVYRTLNLNARMIRMEKKAILTAHHHTNVYGDWVQPQCIVCGPMLSEWSSCFELKTLQPVIFRCGHTCCASCALGCKIPKTDFLKCPYCRKKCNYREILKNFQIFEFEINTVARFFEENRAMFVKWDYR